MKILTCHSRNFLKLIFLMAPPAKKFKLEASSSNEFTPQHLIKKFQEQRNNCGESITQFKFHKKRVRILSSEKEVKEESKGILYWMSRDQRVQDNWAFLFAQKLALKNEIPLHVCFCLVPKFLEATIRHFDFMLKGLEEVEKECRDLNIQFHLIRGLAVQVLPKFVEENEIGAVVTDFSPLRVPMNWVTSVGRALPKDIPFCQVDAHNIVPCWEASPKLEYGARTIRSKINSQLPTYLTQFPPIIKHPYKCDNDNDPVDWEEARSLLQVDETVGPVEWAKPGYTGAVENLCNFVGRTLKTYGTERNDPTKEKLSNMSPWFHFGQISVQRTILCVQEYKSKYSESVAAFCEEAIVRRELADNFCFYNEKYDKVEGTNDWAIKSLNAHRKDKREYIYTLEQFEKGRTHDDLWNAAQKQLVKMGKMHGFLRMYWAKKILEWTESPEQALKFAIYLNDRYNLDGRDPNGYVGCMWSICGIHDQGWAERAVFGKIRYMNYQGCKRKFDVAAFVRKWNK